MMMPSMVMGNLILHKDNLLYSTESALQMSCTYSNRKCKAVVFNIDIVSHCFVNLVIIALVFSHFMIGLPLIFECFGRK